MQVIPCVIRRVEAWQKATNGAQTFGSVRLDRRVALVVGQSRTLRVLAPPLADYEPGPLRSIALASRSMPSARF